MGSGTVQNAFITFSLDASKQKQGDLKRYLSKYHIVLYLSNVMASV